MADKEFGDPRRLELLRELQDALGTDTIRSQTAWAFLWLADIDRLEWLLAEAQRGPDQSSLVTIALEALSNDNVVKEWKQSARTGNSTRASSPSQGDPSPSPSPLARGQKRTHSGSFVSSGPSLANPNVPTASVSSGPPLIPPSMPPPPPPALAQVPRRSPAGRGTDSKNASILCRGRDNHACVITRGSEGLDVAHIFPHSMKDTKDQRAGLFWDTLRRFWSKEKVDRWYNAIFAPGSVGTEGCHNLITLAAHLHRWWTGAIFAFKPVKLEDGETEGDKELCVEFHWLKRKPRDNQAQGTPILDMPELPSLDYGRGLSRVWDYTTGLEVHSGDTITLKSHPVRMGRSEQVIYPELPCWDLLEMQWFLHRLQALSGAAESKEDYYTEGDDEEIEEAEEEDVGYGSDEMDIGSAVPVPIQPISASGWQHPSSSSSSRHHTSSSSGQIVPPTPPPAQRPSAHDTAKEPVPLDPAIQPPPEETR